MIACWCAPRSPSPLRRRLQLGGRCGRDDCEKSRNQQKHTLTSSSARPSTSLSAPVCPRWHRLHAPPWCDLGARATGLPWETLNLAILSSDLESRWTEPKSVYSICTLHPDRVGQSASACVHRRRTLLSRVPGLFKAKDSGVRSKAPFDFNCIKSRDLGKALRLCRQWPYLGIRHSSTQRSQSKSLRMEWH